MPEAILRRHTVTQNQVSHFFTPAFSEESLFVMPHHVGCLSVVPKATIVDSSFTYNKTLTFDCGRANLTSSPHDRLTRNGCVSEEANIGVNPSIGNNLDNVARKLGFYSNECQRDFDDIDLHDFDRHGQTPPAVAHNPGNKNNGKLTERARPKKSFLRTMIRRLSVPRSRHLEANVEPVKLKQGDPIAVSMQQKQPSSPVHSSSVKVRRWFSKRVRRSKNPQASPRMSENLSTDITSAVVGVNNDGQSIGAVQSPGRIDCSTPSESSFRPRKNPFEKRAPAEKVNTSLKLLNHWTFVPSDGQNCGIPEPIDTNLSKIRGYHQSDSAHNINGVLSANHPDHLPVVRRHSFRAVSTPTKNSSASHNWPNVFTPPYLSDSKLALHSTQTEKYVPSYLGISIAAFGYSHHPYGCGHSLTSPLITNKKTESPTCRIDVSAPQLPVSTVSTTVKEGNQLSAMADNKEQPVTPTKPVSVTQRITPPSLAAEVATLQPENAPQDNKLRSNASESDDHWKRSSLIMFAVSHASPRTRPVTMFIPPMASEEQELSFEENSPPSESIKGTLEPQYTSSPPAATSVQPTTGEKHHENGVLHTSQMPTTTATINQPSADTSQSADLGTGEAGTGSGDDCHQQLAPAIDGHFFLRQVDQVEAELQTKIAATESDLNDLKESNDEVCGLLRAAIGKAHLLVNEKFAQFRGLCYENLQWVSRLKSKDGDTLDNGTEEFVTLVSDLDGFWAMVSLQVTAIRLLFDEVNSLRENNWQWPARSVNADESAASNRPKHHATNGGIVTTNEATKVRMKGGNKPRPSTVASRQQTDAQRAKARERLQLFKQTLQAKSSQSPSVADNVLIFA